MYIVKNGCIDHIEKNSDKCQQPDEYSSYRTIPVVFQLAQLHGVKLRGSYHGEMRNYRSLYN